MGSSTSQLQDGKNEEFATSCFASLEAPTELVKELVVSGHFVYKLRKKLMLQCSCEGL